MPSQELLKASQQLALDIVGGVKPWLRSLYRTDKLGSLSEARDTLKMARHQVKQTYKNMPQHHACLDVIEEGVIRGGYDGVLKVIFYVGPGSFEWCLNLFVGRSLVPLKSLFSTL